MGAKVQSRNVMLGLMICVVLVVLLSISNVWSFNTTQSLQNIISAHEKENSDLQSQISTLQAQNTNLQSQIGDLQSQIGDLQSQISDLQSQIGSLKSLNDQLQSRKDLLQSKVDSLQTQNNELQNEIETLKAPQLYKIDVQWTDHPRSATPYVSIQGSIFNSGSESAHDAMLTVRIFDIDGTLLNSKEIDLGTIEGNSYITFNVDVTYSEFTDADSVTINLTYD